MDRKTRKLLTIYRSMHPQGDVDRTYLKRKKGGRGLISVEECVILEKTSQKYGFPTTAKSYEHFVDKEMAVLENEEVKLLWDFSIQTEIRIDHNKPDLVLLDKKGRTCYIIDVVCPFDTRVEKKEKEKFEHNTDLKYELLKVWNREITKVYIIPIVIGALGIVAKNVAKYLEKIDFKPGLDPLQKACFLGTARIMRKVLDYNK